MKRTKTDNKTGERVRKNMENFITLLSVKESDTPGEAMRGVAMFMTGMAFGMALMKRHPTEGEAFLGTFTPVPDDALDMALSGEDYGLTDAFDRLEAIATKGFDPKYEPNPLSGGSLMRKRPKAKTPEPVH